jgi:hypothetical protein
MNRILLYLAWLVTGACMIGWTLPTDPGAVTIAMTLFNGLAFVAVSLLLITEEA